MKKGSKTTAPKPKSTKRYAKGGVKKYGKGGMKKGSRGYTKK